MHTMRRFIAFGATRLWFRVLIAALVVVGGAVMGAITLVAVYNHPFGLSLLWCGLASSVIAFDMSRRWSKVSKS